MYIYRPIHTIFNSKCRFKNKIPSPEFNSKQHVILKEKNDTSAETLSKKSRVSSQPLKVGRDVKGSNSFLNISKAIENLFNIF